MKRLGVLTILNYTDQYSLKHTLLYENVIYSKTGQDYQREASLRKSLQKEQKIFDGKSHEFLLQILNSVYEDSLKDDQFNYQSDSRTKHEASNHQNSKIRSQSCQQSSNEIQQRSQNQFPSPSFNNISYHQISLQTNIFIHVRIRKIT